MGAFEDHTGKVGAAMFKEQLMDHCGAERSEVICGPQFGVDTAVIDLGNDEVLAVSSDPLSLIPNLGLEISAWLSVHLIANDMVTTGFAPQYAQFVLNLPTSLTKEDFQTYWGHIHSLCKKHGITITGGHTGQIPGQESTISGGGTMFLKAPKKQVLTSNQAQSGDVIVVTKKAAISATSLLAMAFPESVKNRCGTETQQKAADNFWELSVMQDALIAVDTLMPNEQILAMHDVTEGGLLGAIQEMASASGCGFEVQRGSLPITEEIRQVADLFAIDPFISIGAGSMVMAVQEGSEHKLINALAKANIEASVVGKFMEGESQQLVDENGDTVAFHFDGNDPYWSAFFHAFKNGWK